MRVGVNISDLDHDRTLRLATQAEDVGLDAVWVGETWGWEAFTLLGELAQVTERVTLGTSIVPVYTRSPSLLGQAAATVARATDGRFVLGLGVSGPAVIENWHGMTFDRPVGRTAETVQVVKRVLSGEPVDHDGREFSLSGFRLRVDSPGPVPVYVGALGETNVRMAAAEADGWMPIFVPDGRLEALTAEFVDSARSHERDPEELSIVPATVAAISDDGAAARDAVRHHIAFYVGAMGSFYHRMLAEADYEEEADAVRRSWREEGPEAAAARVSDEVLDAAAVAGTPEEARDRLQSYEALNVDGVSLFFPRRADGDLMTETAEHLGTMASELHQDPCN